MTIPGADAAGGSLGARVFELVVNSLVEVEVEAIDFRYSEVEGDFGAIVDNARLFFTNAETHGRVKLSTVEAEDVEASLENAGSAGRRDMVR